MFKLTPTYIFMSEHGKWVSDEANSGIEAEMRRVKKSYLIRAIHDNKEYYLLDWRVDFCDKIKHFMKSE